MTDPEVIVIGGGVIVSADVVMPRISHWFGKLLYSPQHRAHPRLVAAQLGEQAGAIGAAMLATSV
jgi:glucokinase